MNEHSGTHARCDGGKVNGPIKCWGKDRRLTIEVSVCLKPNHVSSYIAALSFQKIFALHDARLHGCILFQRGDCPRLTSCLSFRLKVAGSRQSAGGRGPAHTAHSAPLVYLQHDTPYNSTNVTHRGTSTHTLTYVLLYRYICVILSLVTSLSFRVCSHPQALMSVAVFVQMHWKRHRLFTF